MQISSEARCGVRITRADAAAVRSAMAELRASGLITGPARDVRAEMYCALWHYIGGPLRPEVAHSIAHLAGLCYLREQRHLAPTSDLTPLEPDPQPVPSASWFGMLFTMMRTDA